MLFRKHVDTVKKATQPQFNTRVFSAKTVTIAICKTNKASILRAFMKIYSLLCLIPQLNSCYLFESKAQISSAIALTDWILKTTAITVHPTVKLALYFKQPGNGTVKHANHWLILWLVKLMCKKVVINANLIVSIV